MGEKEGEREGKREGEREGGEWVWEWDWNCVVPREGGVEGEEGEERCVYEGGEVVEMPGRGEGIFLGGGEGKRFEKGVPMLFFVNVRVREGEGGVVVAEGRWERVFSVVGEEEGVEIEETRWGCENGGVGYLVRFFFFYFFFFLY